MDDTPPIGRSRRDLLRLGVAGTVLMATQPGAVAAPQAAPGLPAPEKPVRLAFGVLWRGQNVGSHEFAIDPDGRGGMSVRLSTKIRIRIGFITAYRYEQTSDEVWTDGVLTALNSTTNDDGQTSTVTGKRIADNIELRGPGGPYVAPGDSLTTTCVWNDAFVSRTSVIDVGDGTVVGLVVDDKGGSPVEKVGGGKDALRFDIITPYLAGSLWYPPQGFLLQARIERKGETLDYVASA